MADARIEFDTRINNKEFEKGLKNMGTGIEGMKKSLSSVAGAMDNTFGGKYQAKIKEISKRIAELTERQELLKLFAEMDISARGIVSPETAAELEKVTAELDVLRAKLDSISTGAVSRAVDESAKKISELEAKISELRDQLDVERSPQAISNLKKESKDAERELKNLQKAAGGAEDGVEKVSKAARRMPKALKTAGSAILGFFSHLKKTPKHTGQAGNAFEKFFKRVQRLVVAAFVFNLARRGLSQLRGYLTSLMKTNAEFVGSLNSIKVNLATAFQPIFEAVMPAINALMSGLATVTAYLSGVVNALFGKTVESSKAAAKSLNKQAEALKSTGGAAKDAAKGLAAFDQVNQQSDDSSSSAAGSGEFSSAFDAVETPKIDTAWIDEFVQNIKKLEVDEAYFYGLGAKIAGKVNQGLGDIDWGEVQTWADSTAQKIAYFLNGAVAKLDWEKIGKNIAGLINSALEISNTFLTTFDWEKLGTSISSGLNKIISGTNWKLLGATLASKVMSLFNTMHGLFTTLNWSEVGESIANTIDSFFANVDWIRVAETFSEGILGVLSTIVEAVASVDWKQIGENIKTFLVNIDWKGIINAVGQAIGSVASGAFQFLEGLLGSPLATFLTTIATIIGAVVVAVNLWSTAQGILNVVLNANPFALIVTAISVLIGILVTLVTHWDNVKAGMVNAWETVKAIWDTVVGFFQGIIDGIKRVFGIASPSKVMQEIGGFIMQGLLNGITALLQSVINLFVGLLDRIKAIWNGLASWFDITVVKPISNFFEGLWNGIKGGASTLANWLETRVIKPIIELFKGLYNGVMGIVEGMINGFVAIINGFLTGINLAIGVINAIPGVSISKINLLQSVSIPRLAQGGVIPPNNPRAVIVGDNTREDEIISPVSTMKRAFMEAIEEMGGINRGGDISISFEGNLAQLGRLLNPVIKKEEKRAGYRISTASV